jgi:hypothetical protein
MPFWAVESGKQHHVLICFLVYPDCEPFRSNLERLSKTQDMAQQLGTNGPTQFLLFYYSTMPKLGSNLKLYSIWWYSTSTWELYGNYMGIIWELYGNYMGILHETSSHFHVQMDSSIQETPSLPRPAGGNRVHDPCGKNGWHPKMYFSLVHMVKCTLWLCQNSYW